MGSSERQWENLAGKTVFVTGESGFVGAHLVPAMIAERAKVFGVSDMPPLPIESDLYHHTDVDLRKRDDIKSVLSVAEPDAVIHLAAQSHVPTAWDDPERTWRINVLGSLNLLQACSELRRVPRFLMISTGEVYGKPMEVPLDETAPLRPRNPYAASKAAAEILALQMSDAGQVPVVVLRPFNHTGPGQRSQFVCPAFAEQIAKIEAGKQEPEISVGDLSPARDFLDVRDVVQAHMTALCRAEVGEFYNIASGNPRTIQSVLETLLQMTDAKIDVVTDPDRLRPSDTPVISGSAAKFNDATGWEPKIPFEQTLRDLLEQFRAKIRRG